MADDIRSTYNQIAKDYDLDHINDTWDDDYIEYFIEALPSQAKILDLGCGPGADTDKLIKAGLQVSGLDLSDELLKIAQERNPGVEFKQGDMRELPYDDKCFDGVFAKASLLHIPKVDITKVIEEVNRVLKEKGIIHIAIKEGEGESVLEEDDYGYKYSRFFSYWQLDKFEKILNNLGFQIVRSDRKKKSPKASTTWLQIIAQKNK